MHKLHHAVSSVSLGQPDLTFGFYFQPEFETTCHFQQAFKALKASSIILNRLDDLKDQTTGSDQTSEEPLESSKFKNMKICQPDTD